MNFVKQHKTACIISVIVLILLILIIVVGKLFMVDSSKDLYGDRLDGINKVKISDQTVTNLKNSFKELPEVSSIGYRLQGRLIYIELTMKQEVGADVAKDIANKVLEHFDDKQKAYYDIQIMIDNENPDSEGYPIMGNKHKTNEAIVW